MSSKVSTINFLMLVSLVINAGIVAIVMNDPRFPEAMYFVFGGFLLLSILGILLMQTAYFSLGKILALIGFIGYIPIGLIGAFGVRKVADARTREAAGL